MKQIALVTAGLVLLSAVCADRAFAGSRIDFYEVSRAATNDGGPDLLWRERSTLEGHLIVPFKLGREHYMLNYTPSSGFLSIEKLPFDVNGYTTQVRTLSWPAGLTSIIPFADDDDVWPWSDGSNLFLAYNASTGEATVAGIEGVSRTDGTNWLWSGNWGAGLTAIMPFNRNGSPHFLRYKRASGSFLPRASWTIARMQSDGTGVVSSWNPAPCVRLSGRFCVRHDISAWTHLIPFSADNLRPHYLAYNSNTGTLSVYKLTSDGTHAKLFRTDFGPGYSAVARTIDPETFNTLFLFYSKQTGKVWKTRIDWDGDRLFLLDYWTWPVEIDQVCQHSLGIFTYGPEIEFPGEVCRGAPALENTFDAPGNPVSSTDRGRYNTYFGIAEVNWNEGFGYRRHDLLHRPMARTYAGIHILDYAAVDGASIINGAYSYTANSTQRLKPRCYYADGDPYTIASFQKHRLHMEVYRPFFYGLPPIERAAAMLHEARHSQKGHVDCDYDRGVNGCDPSWGYDGAFRYQTEYLIEMYYALWRDMAAMIEELGENVVINSAIRDMVKDEANHFLTMGYFNTSPGFTID